MNPEKEIVNLWLNSHGFFTVNDINAGNNKVIDLLALKLRNGSPATIKHLEVSCSISAPMAEKDSPDYLAKFEDRAVVRKVNAVIKELVGSDCGYEKTLVLTLLRPLALPGVEVISFDDILAEVLAGIDKQNYQNSTVRTLQLVKYLFISSPRHLASILAKDDDNKVLTHAAREQLLTEILSHHDFLRHFEKESAEGLLKRLMKHSSLRRPELLAAAVDELLTTPSLRRRFLESLLKQEKMAQAGKALFLTKEQKPLQYFFSRRGGKAKVNKAVSEAN